MKKEIVILVKKDTYSKKSSPMIDLEKIGNGCFTTDLNVFNREYDQYTSGLVELKKKE